jgi:hypothetical protein
MAFGICNKLDSFLLSAYPHHQQKNKATAYVDRKDHSLGNRVGDFFALVLVEIGQIARFPVSRYSI